VILRFVPYILSSSFKIKLIPRPIINGKKTDIKPIYNGYFRLGWKTVLGFSSKPTKNIYRTKVKSDIMYKFSIDSAGKKIFAYPGILFTMHNMKILIILIKKNYNN